MKRTWLVGPTLHGFGERESGLEGLLAHIPRALFTHLTFPSTTLVLLFVSESQGLSFSLFRTGGWVLRPPPQTLVLSTGTRNGSILERAGQAHAPLRDRLLMSPSVWQRTLRATGSPLTTKAASAACSTSPSSLMER